MNDGTVNESVTRLINAPANALYDMVSDITRMGEWSPECTGGEWIGGADHATIGARFKGTNSAGPNTWSTKPTVTAAERGRILAFEVPGAAGPTWSYTFDEVDGGTLVTESVAQNKRSPLFIRLLQKRAGITDRSNDVRAKMTQTLANLAQVAESSPISAS